MATTKDTEPARLVTLDLNSRAAEKEKKQARAGVRAAAEGRKTAAKKRAYMAAMESSSDDELCDDSMRVGGEAQVRGMKPALMFLLLATCEWPAGAWPDPQTNPQKNELGHQLAAHDSLGVLADVQDGPFDMSVPARPAWTCARAGLYAVAKSRRSRITLSAAQHDLAVVGRRILLVRALLWS